LARDNYSFRKRQKEFAKKKKKEEKMKRKLARKNLQSAENKDQISNDKNGQNLNERPFPPD